FLDSLHECHLQRHLYCYSAVMSCLEEPGKWQQSLALLCEFPSLAVQPDDMAFNAAIRACQGEWVQAFQLLELMRAQQLQPTAIT
ncbi:Pentatricopeptide repeat-containing protein At3g14580, partial [Durusdinium trenchii]